MRYYEIARPTTATGTTTTKGAEVRLEQLSNEVGEQIVQETFELPL